MGDQDTVVSP